MFSNLKIEGLMKNSPGRARFGYGQKECGVENGCTASPIRGGKRNLSNFSEVGGYQSLVRV